MRIFVPQPIPAGPAERLEQLGDVTTYPHTDRRIPYDELLEAVADQDILYAMGEIPYDAGVIAAADRLKYIAAMHGSATFVDKAAATERGIPVSLLGRRSVETTAEFTFVLLVSTAWRIPEADRFMRDGKWKQNQSMAFLGTRLFGKTLGIVGLGKVGTGLAKRARAIGMDIIYSKRTQLTPVQEAALGVDYRSLEDLFRESDFVALTPPLTQETKGMVGADLLALMKPSAILINTSRGLVIDEAALEQALVDGRIRGAGLDVYEREIPEVESPGPSERFMALPNVVLTPHIGTASRESRDDMARQTVENIERFVNGLRPTNVCNPEIYGEEAIHSDLIG